MSHRMDEIKTNLFRKENKTKQTHTTNKSPHERTLNHPLPMGLRADLTAVATAAGQFLRAAVVSLMCLA